MGSGNSIEDLPGPKKVADLVDKFTETILPAFTNHFSQPKHNKNVPPVKGINTGRNFRALQTDGAPFPRTADGPRPQHVKPECVEQMTQEPS